MLKPILEPVLQQQEELTSIDDPDIDPAIYYLLMEDNSLLLQEDGSRLIL